MSTYIIENEDKTLSDMFESIFLVIGCLSIGHAPVIPSEIKIMWMTFSWMNGLPKMQVFLMIIWEDKISLRYSLYYVKGLWNFSWFSILNGKTISSDTCNWVLSFDPNVK